MSFKDISDQELWLILNLDQWFRWRCHLKDFLSRALGPSCSAERNHLCNFGRGHYRKHSCEIILNLDQQFTRCGLKKKLMDHGRRPITIAQVS